MGKKNKDSFCSKNQKGNNKKTSNKNLDIFPQFIINKKLIEDNKNCSLKKKQYNSLVISKWEFLDWHEQGLPRTYEEAIKNASEYLKKTLDIDKFKAEKLSLAKLSILNLGNFKNAMTKRRIKWNDIKNKLEINNYNQEFLNWKNNPKISYKDAVINGANYFLKYIYTEDFLELYKLTYGIAPKLNQIKSYGYSNFVQGLNFHKVLYSDIINYLDFSFVQKSKWDKFSWSQNGIPRIYSKAISNASLFFINNIYPKIKNVLGLKSNIAPSLNQLRINGYEDFLSAIYKKDLKYSEIVKHSSLKLLPSLWSSFNWKKNSRNKKDAFNNIISYYCKNIDTEELRNYYNLKNDFAPTLSMINEFYDRDFYSAIYSRGFGYSEIINYLNLRHSTITEQRYKWGELSFSFKKDQLLNNKFLGKKVFKYFSNFTEINFPFNIFKDSQFRASHFQFKGSKNADTWINYKDILDYFKEYISISNNQLDIQIKDYTNKFFKNFSTKNNNLPTHNDILPYIFKTFNSIKALEVPTYKYISQINRYYTGHMDLWGIENDIITIYDLKRNLSQVLKGIPQFFCYYYLLDHSLKLIDQKGNYKIRFVGLTPSEVYEIDCNSLENPILKYIKNNPSIKGRFTDISFLEAFKGLIL